MAVADAPFAVDDEHRRHAPLLEQANLLAVSFGHVRAWIRQPWEGHIVLLPVAPEGVCSVGANYQDLCASPAE